MQEIKAYSPLTGFIFLCNSDYSKRGERERKKEKVRERGKRDEKILKDVH